MQKQETRAGKKKSEYRQRMNHAAKSGYNEQNPTQPHGAFPAESTTRVYMRPQGKTRGLGKYLERK